MRNHHCRISANLGIAAPRSEPGAGPTASGHTADYKHPLRGPGCVPACRSKPSGTLQVLPPHAFGENPIPDFLKSVLITSINSVAQTKREVGDARHTFAHWRAAIPLPDESGSPLAA